MKYKKAHVLKEAIKHKGFISKIPVIFRMFRAWKNGTYSTNIIDLALPALGLLYVLSPIDLLPEIALPGIGALDDLAVLALIIPKLMKEVDKFLLWEGMGKEGTTIIDVEAEEVK